MDDIKKNNKHLISLLDKYHSGRKPNFPHDYYNDNDKFIDMQTEIDVRDLRIKELEEEIGNQSPSVNLGMQYIFISFEWNKHVFKLISIKMLILLNN